MVSDRAALFGKAVETAKTLGFGGRHRAKATVLMILLLAPPLRSEPAKLNPVSPCAALVAAAETHRIPMDQIDPSGEVGEIEPGDSITALVTLFEKGERRTQWLLYLEASSAPKPPSSNASTRMVMYGSTGNKLEFVSAPTPVTLRTLGPFDASERTGKPTKGHKTAHFTLNKDFLGLGLDHTAVALLRLKQTKVKGAFRFSDKPLTERDLDENQKLTGTVKLTPEEERALAGSVPALLSYFNIVQQTEGLSDILFELIDLPSMWSLLRKGGVKTNFRYINENLGRADESIWNLPARVPVYDLPMLIELNEHPALKVTFVATNPRPPLLLCGGVVGMLAEKPGNKSTYLTLRVISARRAKCVLE